MFFFFQALTGLPFVAVVVVVAVAVVVVVWLLAIRVSVFGEVRAVGQSVVQGAWAGRGGWAAC